MVLDKTKKLVGLSPMEGVTDSVFRQVLCRIGRPDIFLTEFLNVDGYCSKGKKHVVHRISFTEEEKPLIIQLWGNTPEYYEKTIDGIMPDGLKPDGIDINMGCSVKDVLSGGRGSALINNPGLAKEIIESAKIGCAKYNLPLSVKTRIGYDQIDTENWIGFLLEQHLDMITVHGRTSKQTYTTPANWEEIGKCIPLRDKISPTTLILGNGDLKSKKEGDSYVKKYNLDGYLIGRQVMNNPWVFAGRESADVSKQEKIQTFLLHLDLYEKTFVDRKPFAFEKKYVKAYLSDFEGVNELRREILLTEDIASMREILYRELDN